MDSREHEKKWRNIFFGTLILSVLMFAVLFQMGYSLKTQEKKDGHWGSYVWDLEDGTRVQYGGFVEANGGGQFKLLKVCNMETKECREPNPNEIKENVYLPE